MFNEIILAGHLCRKPEVKFTSAGKEMVRFSIAVNRYDNNVDFFNCVSFAAPVVKCSSYLDKGSSVLVRGRLQTYKKEGGNVLVSVIVESVTFLSKKSESKDIAVSVDSNDIIEFEEIPF